MPSKKILIVEDDKPSGLMLKRLLENYGYLVIGPVSTGEEAVKKSDEARPDLVLMDITLQGEMDGIDAAIAIKSKNNMPILYLTVSTDDDIIQRAKATMPYGYILKPYNKNLLHATLEIALYKIDVEQKLRETEERNKEILASIPDRMFRINKGGSFSQDSDAMIAGDIWPEKVSRKAAHLIEKVLKTGELAVFEYALKKGGGTSYYEARILFSNEMNVLVIVRDVTEKKTVELELQSYKNNLEELVESRTREVQKVNTDLMREIDVRKAIEQNLNIFSYAIEQSPNLVVIINKDGIIQYINRKFVDVCGFGSDDLIGSSIHKHGNCIIPEPEIWNEITGVDTWKGEIYNLTKNNEIIYLNATVSTIRDEAGNVLYYLIIGEDITEKKKERKLLEDIQKTVLKKQKETNDLELDWQEWKEKMLSRNISRTDKSLFRNINNSFTQGAGFGTLISLFDMMNGNISKKNGKYTVDGTLYDMIERNVVTAQDAFRTFSSIDWIISNDFDLELFSFYDFYQLVKAAIVKANEFTQFKNNKIVLSEYNGAFKDIFIKVNREYIFQAIYEMLINAMKFSKKQTPIVIMVYMVNRNVTLSVVNDPERSDEGTLGIPSEYEKVVFEPFYRLTKYVFEQYHTLDFGLGLTLVEKIVGKHGGEVVAENLLDHSDLKREPLVKAHVCITFPIPMD